MIKQFESRRIVVCSGVVGVLVVAVAAVAVVVVVYVAIVCAPLLSPRCRRNGLLWRCAAGVATVCTPLLSLCCRRTCLLKPCAVVVFLLFCSVLRLLVSFCAVAMQPYMVAEHATVYVVTGTGGLQCRPAMPSFSAT